MRHTLQRLWPAVAIAGALALIVGATPSAAPAIQSVLLYVGAIGAQTALTATAGRLNVTVGAGTIAAANGGTGQSSYTIGDLLYASGATALSKLADVAVGSVLCSGGVTTAPSWCSSPQLTSVKFGGTTSSFPMWKNSGAAVVARLADDSGDANIQGAGITGSLAVSGSALRSSSAAVTAGSGTGVTVNDVGQAADLTYKVSVLSTNFIAAAVTADVTVATLPAKTKLTNIVLDLTTPFACTGTCTTSTLSMTCGSSAGGNDLLVTFDADAATLQRGLADADLGTGINRASAIQAGKIFSWTATTPVSCRLTSGTGNIGTGAATNLSQGAFTVYLTTTRMP